MSKTDINTLLTAEKKDEEDIKDLLRGLKVNHICWGQDYPIESTCMQYLAT